MSRTLLISFVLVPVPAQVEILEGLRGAIAGARACYHLTYQLE